VAASVRPDGWNVIPVNCFLPSFAIVTGLPPG
jgi:hypothetical protein